MKRILSVILAILVCCMSFVSVLGVSADTVDSSKKLSVSSNTEGARYLVDANGNPVQLFGMARLQSAAGSNEESADASVVAAKYKNLGLNYMRLAININDIKGETALDSLQCDNDEEIDAWIDEVIAPDVAGIISQGMYVGIDMHMYAPAVEYQEKLDENGNVVLGKDGKPEMEIKVEATEKQTADYARNNYLPVLKRLAAKYKDEPMVANIEIWNEPNLNKNPAPSNADWNSELRQYFIDTVTEIRGVGFDGVILVSDSNAGWQNHTDSFWNGYYEDLYVGGNRNIAFSQHVSGKQLDPASTDDDGNPNYTEGYMDEVCNSAMENNLCVMFNEVEAECGETNTTAGIEAFCAYIEEVQDDFHFSACLWRPRTDYMNRVWVWGTSGWAAEYTGGTLVIAPTFNWFSPDGTTTGSGWKINHSNGSCITYVDGDAHVGLTEEYAYTASVKTNSSENDIQFTRNWYQEKKENGTLATTKIPVDLTGYNYVVMKVKFPTTNDDGTANGSADYALGITGSNNEFIRVDEKVTASFDDYKKVLNYYSTSAKAGEWVTLALPLSETLSGNYDIVSFDPGFAWNNKGLTIHIASIDFATAEYVAENYAAYTPAGVDAELAKAPKTYNWFKTAPYNQGDQSNWTENTLFHAITGWGVSIQTTEPYYGKIPFIYSKDTTFRNNGSWVANADLTGMSYIKIRLAFGGADGIGGETEIAYVLEKLRSGNNAFIDVGGAVATFADLHTSISKQQAYLVEGKFIDVVLPFSKAIEGDYKTITLNYMSSVWEYGHTCFIESIDFANASYAAANWSDKMVENLVAPNGLNVYTPANHGTEGCGIAGNNLSVDTAPEDYTSIAWGDRDTTFTKNWHPYDVNGFDHLAIKFKFDDAESAAYALSNMTANSTGVFATVHGGTLGWSGQDGRDAIPVGTLATASYDDFKAALLAKSYELLKCEDYVTIVVPFDQAISLSENLKTVKVTANFGFKYSEPAIWLHVASVDLVNAPYVDLYLSDELTVENAYLKLKDGPDYTMTSGWEGQLSVATDKAVATHSSMTSITFDLTLPEAETLRPLMNAGSKGGTATADGMQYGGGDFAIYFTGTNVSRVGVRQDTFFKAIDDNMEALKAGERVTLTLDLDGTFVSGGTITGIKLYVTHPVTGNDTSAFSGAAISLSHIYFNYNAETFPEYDDADLDLDGTVGATDLTMIKKAMFETEVDIDNINYGDVNGDGKFDILDCVAVAKKALIA